MKVNRRSFAKTLGTMAAAVSSTSAGLMASAPDGREIKPVRYGIVGLGRISLKHFMPGCKMSEYSKVTALVSGDRAKAEAQASEYGVAPKSIYSYKNFDDIAHDPEIDAVYIALPNSMHAEYTVRAAKAGKHVLCEKPMATTVQDSEHMISACRDAGKKLMIAYRCHYEPMNLKAIEIIRSGALGTIQAIESANGFNESKGEWRLNRKLAGGGPLMDVGIYSLNACRYLTGEEPAKLEAYSSVIDKDGRFDEVEENVSWTMRFPSGVVASCNTTYGAPMEGYFRVHGSKGVLHMEPAFGYEGIRLRTQIKGQSPQEEVSPLKDPEQFKVEADYFSRCILDNKQPRSSGEEGLRDMKLMESIYKASGLRMG
jgi:predicted dehydrogenase